MTPTIISKELLPLNNKLRKPMVEKMRRDRINSSIEQLKCLLAQFLKQQPDSKLEKADILEMTLNFLQRHNSSSHAVNQGFSRCVGEIEHFLSKDEMKTQSQRRLLKHFQKLQTSCDKCQQERHLEALVEPYSNQQHILNFYTRLFLFEEKCFMSSSLEVFALLSAVMIRSSMKTSYQELLMGAFTDIYIRQQ